jgi:hypothetical protein
MDVFWSLAIIVATTTLHATGVVTMASIFVPIRMRLAERQVPARSVMLATIGVVALIGLLLIALLALEAALWAAAYLWLGALTSPADAVLFSLGALTTAGAPGLTLPRAWQSMGLLESLNGVLLFGISTAYMFAVMQDYWSLLRRGV